MQYNEPFFTYSSVSLSKCMQWCHHHLTQVTEQRITPKILPGPPCGQSLPPHLVPNEAVCSLTPCFCFPSNVVSDMSGTVSFVAFRVSPLSLGLCV